MKLGARHSPSGARPELQLPFYQVTGISPGTFFVPVNSGSLVAEADEMEFGAYLILTNGRLATLLVQNILTGDDSTVASYRARKNGVSVGEPVLIANNAPGPVRVDLSFVTVSPGDTVGLRVTFPAFAGSAPVPKLGYTWMP